MQSFLAKSVCFRHGSPQSAQDKPIQGFTTEEEKKRAQHPAGFKPTTTDAFAQPLYRSTPKSGATLKPYWLLPRDLE